MSARPMRTATRSRPRALQDCGGPGVASAWQPRLCQRGGLSEVPSRYGSGAEREAAGTIRGGTGRAREPPSRRLESRRRLTAISVGKGSTIRIYENTYSVHSRLMGEGVDVTIGMEEVEVWYADQIVQRMPRLCGSGKHAINYRHIIDSLVRKPGAFENYVYREDLFPTSHFRMAYDALCRQHAGKRAVREYLKILQLAAKQSEAVVQDALCLALSQGVAISSAAIEAAVQPLSKFRP